MKSVLHLLVIINIQKLHCLNNSSAGQSSYELKIMLLW